ncbi:MAG: hypothetical protein PHG27_08060 [Massilibacteroides sp.]|nr:hypothetical protein [Massilibacteroides sp.]MDD3062524.1 hypothetical protein [Massilibacteroides sp.]MDD4115531.1 hypothetical protein [Massilibacteroides sp.]MDD4660330.1 hypothetical protein [Massilibacteroides sp.]
MNTNKLKSWWRKFRNFSLAILFLAAILFFAIRYYYPYGEGVKTGQLNFVVYKGILFKTYEGKLIQSGIWSNKPGGIQSNEFEFSIENKAVAEELMHAGGKTVELHYKEYFAAIPWRGFSRYVVDEIVRIGNETPADISGILPETE